MNTLKLIRLQNGEMALLSNIECFPEADWLAIQKQRPVAGAKWFRAWPLKGGQMLVQQAPGSYDVVSEVADQVFIDNCCDGKFDGFNPAGNAIRTYLAS